MLRLQGFDGVLQCKPVLPVQIAKNCHLSGYYFTCILKSANMQISCNVGKSSKNPQRFLEFSTIKLV